MIDIQSLCNFLVKAKKATYASGNDSSKIIEPDQSTSLTFTLGNYKYHDNYFGGEPFGGREIVFFNGKPIYIMTYYGWVKKSATDINEIYQTLQKALLQIPLDHPYRGPESITIGNYVYTNKFQGDVTNFSGNENIMKHKQIVYQAKYSGGLVDQSN